MATGLDLINSATNPSTASLRPEDAKSVKSAAGNAAKKLSDNFDEFMLLLTTQLQHQDPTEPLDTNEFTAQLVQFSTVEQAVATNTNLEKLVSLTSGNQVNSAVSFIGKTIEMEGSSGFLKNSKAEFSYDVPAGAEKVTLTILNAQNQPVYTTNAPARAGKQSFVWDGTNSFTGKKMADGIYKFGLITKDAAGKTLETKTFTSGKVTGVALDKDELTLTVGDAFDVPMSKVISVREQILASAQN
jgi:flagellar basal-body rod modification protein FlgD